jgi:hypothetical protein
MNERELGAKVAAEYGQEFEGTVEGPACFGPFTASRVWTYDGSEYHAHYAIEQRGRPLRIFEDFLRFAAWLGKEFNLDGRLSRAERIVRMSVATVVVLVALGVLVFLIVERPQQSGEIKYLLAAIVGAAASYVFLTRAPKMPAG